MFWLKLNPKGFISVPGSFVYTSEETFPSIFRFIFKDHWFQKIFASTQMGFESGFLCSDLSGQQTFLCSRMFNLNYSNLNFST